MYTRIEEGGYETRIVPVTVPVTRTVESTLPVTVPVNAIIIRLKTLVYKYSTIYGKPQTRYVTKYSTVYTTNVVSVINSYVATRIVKSGSGGAPKPTQPVQKPGIKYTNPAIAPGHNYGTGKGGGKRRQVLVR